MVDLSVIRRLEMRADVPGASEAATQLRNMQGGFEAMQRAAEAATKSIEKNGQMIISTDRQYQNFLRRSVPGFREFEQFTRDLKMLDAALSQNRGVEDFSRNFDLARQKLPEVRAEMDRLKREAQETERAMSRLASVRFGSWAERSKRDTEFVETIMAVRRGQQDARIQEDHDAQERQFWKEERLARIDSRSPERRAQIVADVRSIRDDITWGPVRAGSLAERSARDQNMVEQVMRDRERREAQRQADEDARQEAQFWREQRRDDRLSRIDRRSPENRAQAEADVREARGNAKRAAGERELGGYLDERLQQADPLTAAYKRHEEAVARINRARQIGLRTEQELASILVYEAKVLHEVERDFGSGKSGFRAHQRVNLGYQANDVIGGLIMGQSPFMVAAQQGPQVAQILGDHEGGVRGGVKALGRDLLGLIPTSAMVWGGIASGAALAALAIGTARDRTREFEMALRVGAGRRSGMVASDIEALAAGRGNTFMSRGDARNAALTFGSAGMSRDIVRASLGTADSLAQAVFGGDMGEAQKALTVAFKGGAKGMVELVDSVNPLSAAQRNMLEMTYAANGDLAGFSTGLKYLNDGLRGAVGEVPLWRRGLNRLGDTASDLADAFLKEGQRKLEDTVREARGIASGVGSFLATSSADARRGSPLAIAGGVRAPVQGGDPFNLPLPPDVGNAGALIESEVQGGKAGAREVDALTRAYGGEAAALFALQKDLAAYDRLLGSNAVRQEMSTAELVNARLARERLAAQIRDHSTAEQDATRAFELGLQSTRAYTVEQRLAAVSAQRMEEVSRNKALAHTKEAEATRAVTLEMEKYKAAAEQSLRAALDQYKTAGMLPFPKQLAELAIKRDRSIQQFGNADLYNSIYAAEAATARRNASAAALYQMNFGINEQYRAYEFQRGSFGQPDQVVETMRSKMEMLNAAMRDGQTVTERYGAGWEALAAQMGKAKAATDELARAQQNVIAGLDELRSGSRGLTTGIFSDLRQGQNPTKNIANNLGRMADQMFDRTVSKPLFESLMGRDGTGQLGLLGQGLNSMGLGGLLGDTKTGIFGGMPTTTASMSVNAAVVNIGGAGIAGFGAGFPGGTGSLPSVLGGLGGTSSPYATAAAQDAAMRATGASDLARSDYATSLLSRMYPGTTPSLPTSTLGWSPDAIGRAIEQAGKGAAGALDATAGGLTSAGDGLVKSLGGIGDLLSSGGKIIDRFAPTVGSMGWAAGGYTGHGGRYEPAGVVHRGEYVFSAHAVSRIGLGTLDAMHSGVPGYAAGGLVRDPVSASMQHPLMGRSLLESSSGAMLGYRDMTAPKATLPSPVMLAPVIAPAAAPSLSINVKNEMGGRAEVQKGSLQPDGKGGYTMDMVVREVERRLAGNMMDGRGALRGAVRNEAGGSAGTRMG